MKLGIIGTHQSGKTTLFNALTSLNIDTLAHPKNNVNIGTVMVPDERMEKLIEIYTPKKITYASCEFVDIVDSQNTTCKNELGSQKLGHFREVDVIIQIIRCFENPHLGIIGISPIKEIEEITLELILADIDVIQRKIERLQKQAKSGDIKIKEQLKILLGLKETLDKNIPLRNKKMTQIENEIIRELQLLTTKKILYIANIKEKDIPGDNFIEMIHKSIGENIPVIAICALIEADLVQLQDEEKKEYMKEIGIEKSGLDKLINSCYSMFDLVTFFTCGQKEVKAYPIHQHTKAPLAAGKIHSDIERGFIRAEVMNYKDLITFGSESKVKENKLYRLEGKEYEVQDGDIFCFRFNV
ncbi:MAG: redox-regulated ATPase YchF [bacterium]